MAKVRRLPKIIKPIKKNNKNNHKGKKKWDYIHIGAGWQSKYEDGGIMFLLSDEGLEKFVNHINEHFSPHDGRLALFSRPTREKINDNSPDFILSFRVPAGEGEVYESTDEG